MYGDAEGPEIYGTAAGGGDGNWSVPSRNGRRSVARSLGRSRSEQVDRAAWSIIGEWVHGCYFGVVDEGLVEKKNGLEEALHAGTELYSVFSVFFDISISGTPMEAIRDSGLRKYAL